MIAFPYAKPCKPSPDAPFAVEGYGLCARYAGSGHLALDNVTVRVRWGTCFALVGPNGAGKSTLLKVIAGLLPLQTGDLRVLGHAAGACRAEVAYLAQRSEIDWSFPVSVRRLVVSGRYPRLGWLRLPSREDWRAADKALEQVGLRELAERQISELSGGQQQRALLARALAQEASLLLLDEPLNAVDAVTQAIIGEVLHNLARRGKTVIVATHDLDRVQREFDDAVFLSDGRVAASGVQQVHDVARHWAHLAQA